MNTEELTQEEVKFFYDNRVVWDYPVTHWEIPENVIHVNNLITKGFFNYIWSDSIVLHVSLTDLGKAYVSLLF